MYELIFDEVAIDFLNKLERDLKERIFKKIISAKENPLRFFEGMTGKKDFKLRVGDYRVISDIDKRKKQIRVTLIGHRKNVYDK